MAILVAGLVVFLGVHLLPKFVSLRAALVGKLGEIPYKTVFSLASFAGLGLIVWGWPQAPYVDVYQPPAWGRHLAMLLVPIALILLGAANMPGHIRYRLKHPMMIGTLLWAVAHLSANGDLRSLLLFGSFGVFAIVDIVSETARGRTLVGSKPPRVAMDAAAVVGGLVLTGVLVHFHGRLFGMPLIAP